MRKAFFTVLILAIAAGFAYADPGPEIDISDNYCHFVKSADNGNNEVFAAGCDGKIAADGRGGASGYARIVEWVARAEAKTILGDQTSILITSEESNDVCEMIESNGRQYNSENWRSRISYRRGRIVYELICLDGVQK